MNEIGEILKDARIEKGYTLDDLQQTTKIQKRYLQAIEDGNTDILPGRFYARAFIKQYADIVDLDGEQLLNEHLDESSKEASEEFAESVNVPPTRSTQGNRGGFLDNISEYLPTILIFLLVAAILLVIYIANLQINDGNGNENALINEEPTEQTEPPVTDETNEEVEENSDENASSENTDADSDENEENNQEETEEETEDSQEVTIASSTGTSTTYEISGSHPEEQSVELSASGGDSWVSVSVDGGSEEAAMLSDGQSLDVSFGADVSTVDIIIGNAPATNVSLNETLLDYAPEASDVVRQDLHLEFTN